MKTSQKAQDNVISNISMFPHISNSTLLIYLLMEASITIKKAKHMQQYFNLHFLR